MAAKKTARKKTPRRKTPRALPWIKGFNEVIVNEVIAPRLNNTIASSDEPITTMKQFRGAFESTYAVKVSPPVFREWCTHLGYSFKAALSTRSQDPYSQDGSIFRNPRTTGILTDALQQAFTKSELLNASTLVTPGSEPEGDLLDDGDPETDAMGPLGGPPAPVRQPVDNDPWGVDYRTAVASRSDTPGVTLAPRHPGS
jgi:hypothetical protein